jgi:hypothetical protein
VYLSSLGGEHEQDRDPNEEPCDQQDDKRGRLIRLPSTRNVGRSNSTDRGARRDSRTAIVIAAPQRMPRRQPSAALRDRPTIRASAASPMIVPGRGPGAGGCPEGASVVAPSLDHRGSAVSERGSPPIGPNWSHPVAWSPKGNSAGHSTWSRVRSRSRNQMRDSHQHQPGDTYAAGICNASARRSPRLIRARSLNLGPRRQSPAGIPSTCSSGKESAG